MTLAQTYRTRKGHGRAGALVALTLSLTLAGALSAPAFAKPAFAKDEAWDPDFVITVPSGQEISFLDVIRGEESAAGTAIRYRFLAPGIARNKGNVVFSQAEEDMAALCQDYVLPWIVVAPGEMPDQIIIVLSDREVEFGVADPDATQYFEAYRPEDGACFWEGF